MFLCGYFFSGEIIFSSRIRINGYFSVTNCLLLLCSVVIVHAVHEKWGIASWFSWHFVIQNCILKLTYARVPYINFNGWKASKFHKYSHRMRSFLLPIYICMNKCNGYKIYLKNTWFRYVEMDAIWKNYNPIEISLESSSQIYVIYHVPSKDHSKYSYF